MKNVVFAVGGFTVVVASACGAFDSGDGSSSGGGSSSGSSSSGTSSGPGPVDGTPQGSLVVRIDDAKKTFTHGKTEKLFVTVERKDGFAGEVTIGGKDLPTGITVRPLTLDPIATTGEIELTIDKSAVQGDLKAGAIEAADPKSTLRASTPLNAFVRGAPGELDTTFATNGILTLPKLPNVVQYDHALDGEGRLYVANPTTVRRYIDGVEDKSYLSDFNGTAARERCGVAVAGNAVYTCEFGEVTKYKLATGESDKSWAGGDGVLTIFGGPFGFAFDATGYGISFGPTTDTGGGLHSTVITLDGAAAVFHEDGTSTIRAAVMKTPAYIGVGGAGIIQKRTAQTGALDTTFGGGGTGKRVIHAEYTFEDIAEDAQGRFVISGWTSTKALVLLRVKADGTADATFPTATSNFVTSPHLVELCTFSACINAPVSGRIRIQADGKILQGATIEDQGTTKCVLQRFNADGTVDGTFGEGGKSVLPVPGCVARRMHLQPDGRVVIGEQLITRVWN